MHGNRAGGTRTVALVIVVGLLALSGCLEGTGLDDLESDDDASGTTMDGVDGLEIHHLDVGQGDSTLIVTPAGETILIDTGDWPDDGETVLEYLEAQGIDRIDHLVATHGHADHVGGHAGVIEHLETAGAGIGAAYDSGVVHDSATYERYLDAVETHDVDLFVVEAGNELPLETEGLAATVLNPPVDGGEDLDANSVALAVEYGDVTYLTTGDVGAEGESRLVDTWGEDLAADVYQAGHHGSSTSSSAPLLERVDPDVAVISSAYESQYGHPHDEVLERLADRGVETYWTGVHGDVVVQTDGESVTVQPEREFSTDAADLLAEKPSDDAASIAPGASADGLSPAAEYSRA